MEQQVSRAGELVLEPRVGAGRVFARSCGLGLGLGATAGGLLGTFLLIPACAPDAPSP